MLNEITRNIDFKYSGSTHVYKAKDGYYYFALHNKIFPINNETQKHIDKIILRLT